MLSVNSLHVHGIVRNGEITVFFQSCHTKIESCLKVRDAANDREFQTFWNTRHWPCDASCCSMSALLAIQEFLAITVLSDRISCWSGRRGMREQSSRKLQTACGIARFCSYLIWRWKLTMVQRNIIMRTCLHSSNWNRESPTLPEAYKDLRLCGSPVVS